MLNSISILLLIMIFVLVAIVVLLRRLHIVASNVLRVTRACADQLPQIASALDKVEHQLTGTHLTDAYFKERGYKLRSDGTSLREYLERSDRRWKDVAELRVELEHFRELWELTQVELRNRSSFRNLKLQFVSDILHARGIYGESHDRWMRRYRRFVFKETSSKAGRADSEDPITPT